ncbi:MAG: hypothetical protein QXZ43_02755 [Candidatus Aenigmatarchaeota archaeon]
MKGLSVEYVAFVIIFFFVVIVGIQIIKNIGTKSFNSREIKYNATYNCIMLNDTEINKDELSEIIYGFLTDQCDEFYFKSKNRLTISDLERIVFSIKNNIKIIKIEDCSFPPVNTDNFYVNFDIIKPGDKIYLNRKKIINSDILMCIV